MELLGARNSQKPFSGWGHQFASFGGYQVFISLVINHYGTISNHLLGPLLSRIWISWEYPQMARSHELGRLSKDVMFGMFVLLYSHESPEQWRLSGFQYVLEVSMTIYEYL